MIASFYDVIWINLETRKEIDIDDTFGIGDIRSIKFNDESFFILANKSDRKLGYYLIQMYSQNPQDKQKQPKYIIGRKSYYDTGDANIHFMRIDQSKLKDRDEHGFDNSMYIVIS